MHSYISIQECLKNHVNSSRIQNKYVFTKIYKYLCLKNSTFTDDKNNALRAKNYKIALSNLSHAFVEAAEASGHCCSNLNTLSTPHDLIMLIPAILSRGGISGGSMIKSLLPGILKLIYSETSTYIFKNNLPYFLQEFP